VGTAGHVDHGKTVLVKALTGKDTDRLKEEKERGISIELGFAPLQLHDGTNVGIVDVPGHERFIRQMLAGVAGMDLVMLVIAADESVMPQTQEHLDIIDLLQVKSGIVVITKKDLVEEEWLDLVQEEVKDVIAETVLVDAPIIAVSAVTGEGMDELKSLLAEKIAYTPPKSTSGKLRLPIDRKFSVTGFGTVVTGTLWGGEIKVGDQVEIMPEGLSSRVRNLQVHGDTVNSASAGQRVAVNLADVELEELHRGQMITVPGLLTPSHRMDVQLKLLTSAAKPLKQRARVRLYLGTAETFARVNLLDREEIKPGESCFCQFMIEEPLVGARQDRFVVRTYSPMHTIGGGVVIDAAAPKHKRYRPRVLESLATRLQGTPAELIMQTLIQGKQMVSIPQIEEELGLSQADIQQGIAKLDAKNRVLLQVNEGTEVIMAVNVFQKLSDDAKKLLQDFHQHYPLRVGMPKEELRSRMFPLWKGKQFNSFLQAAADSGWIKVIANEVALSSFQVQANPELQKQMGQILKQLEENPFQPPLWPEVVRQVGLNDEAVEILSYMIRIGSLERISDQLVFSRKAVDEAKRRIGQYIEEKGTISLGEVRDLLDSSRKYVLPLLEYFDQIKFTKRVQDKRILF